MSNSSFRTSVYPIPVEDEEVLLPTEFMFNHWRGYIMQGSDDRLPERIIDLVDKSNTAGDCVDVITKFIEGSGIEDDENDKIYNTKVNDFQTLGELISDISNDISLFHGFYVHFSYNMNGGVIAVRHMPYEHMRVGIPDDFGNITKFAHNPKYDDQAHYNESHTRWYDAYTPDYETLKGQMERGKKDKTTPFRGHILFIRAKRPRKRIYPVPHYMSYGSQLWMKIDYKIANFHNNNLDSNFMISSILNMVGDPEETVKDEHGRDITKGELTDEMMSKNFSGHKNPGKVMVFWHENADDAAKLAAFPTNSHHEMFLNLENSTKENIVQAFGVPHVLANFKTAGQLGQNEEFANTVAFMQGKTEPYRRLLYKLFDVLSKNFEPLKGKKIRIEPFRFDIRDNKNDEYTDETGES